MRVLPSFCAVVLGVGAGLLTGCGGDRSALIPRSDAQALAVQLQAVSAAASARECQTTTEALDRAQATVDGLPSSVDDKLVTRLRSGLERLQTRAVDECAQPPEVTTTTVPTTTTPVEPPPQTTSEQTTPPETTSADTTPTTPSVPDTTPTDPGTGGVSPDPGTTDTVPPEDGGASPTDPGTGGALP